jgi:hypothetical protein
VNNHKDQKPPPDQVVKAEKYSEWNWWGRDLTNNAIDKDVALLCPYSPGRTSEIYITARKGEKHARFSSHINTRRD